MARMASLSEVEVEEDLRLRPPATLPVSSAVDEEQQRTMKKEEGGRNRREVKWISCFNG